MIAEPLARDISISAGWWILIGLGSLLAGVWAWRR